MEDLDKIYGEEYTSSRNLKSLCSISIEELLTYPTIKDAAEAYATWHDGNLPSEMLVNDFIKGANCKFKSEQDLENQAYHYAIWHDGNFPSEVLINNFKIAAKYSYIRKNDKH